mgnify:CR=1 FL=1
MKYKLFNPCSNGILKYKRYVVRHYFRSSDVLILVLMEYKNTNLTNKLHLKD